MSSGQYKKKHPFNKSIIKDGVVVILNKNGTERHRKDPVSGKIIKK